MCHSEGIYFPFQGERVGAKKPSSKMGAQGGWAEPAAQPATRLT
jgi:hypothetical protein